MRFFTYGRKSVYSDKSDSIDNQNRMCREYCEMRFPGEIDSWQQFSDEDFTGANTNRPGFQEMMQLLREDMCDVVVVYQLDRFSRNVRDFSEAYTEMQNHNVRFICLDMNIDTSTPIGEAMMYVSAAFGQMERKNTAQRVTDNMYGLSKKGYWLGGTAPLGYTSTKFEINGRKHTMLVPVPEDVEYVHWIFDTWLNFPLSVRSMETKFKNEGIKTRNGKYFSAVQIYNILTSAAGCAGTKEVYDYFEKLGCKMETPRELWDGSNGIIIYGKLSNKHGRRQRTAPEEWSVSLGVHKPILDAEKWLSAQNKMTHGKCYKTKKYPTELLKGVLRCSCSAMMSVQTQTRRDGSIYRSYNCRKRMNQGIEYCDVRQVGCKLLNDKVIEVFSQIKADPDIVNKYIGEVETKATEDPKKLQRKITNLEDKIGRLAASLAMAEGSAASKYIIAEIETLDAELKTLNAKKRDAERASRELVKQGKDISEKTKEITELIENFDNFTPDERNEIMKSVVKKMTWDGSELFIML